MRRRRWWWIIGILVVVVGATIAWYLASPLFISKTVVEEFPGVTVLTRGKFVDADAFHKGSGVALIAQVNGQRLLRLEEFQVTNGPDLYVYLTAHPKPATREDVHQGFLNLGRLKGNIGAQNYEIPVGAELPQFHSVVIYCQRFHVVFATATLGGVQ